MTTTTQVTDIAQLLDLTAYAGDFVDDYDMDAVHNDHLEALNDAVPDGIYVAASGTVFADVDVADIARDLNFKEIADGIDVEPIFQRHDKVARLLPEVTAAADAVAAADRRRAAAIRAAKDSGRFTVGEIGKAAGLTRDGVYKLLGRADI